MGYPAGAPSAERALEGHSKSMKFDNRPNRLLIDLYRKSIFIDGNRLKMVPDTFELRISNNIERGF